MFERMPVAKTSLLETIEGRSRGNTILMSEGGLEKHAFPLNFQF